MLQRLFSRHASEDRIGDAVDHGKGMEEREALRERSHVILERLARKQAAAREEAAEARRAARDAAARAAEEARTVTPPADPAGHVETPAAQPTAGEMMLPAETPAIESETTQAQASSSAGDTAAQESTAQSMAEPAVAAASDHPNEDAAPTAAAHDRHEQPHYEAPGTEPPAGEGGSSASPETPAHSSHSAYSEPAADAAPQHAPGLHDDPEALEEIRRKAEEARARIAARLQQMETDEHQEETETDPSNGRLDLGEETPPVLPDETED